MPRPLPPVRRATLGLAVLGLAAVAAPALADDSSVTVSGTGTVTMTQPTVGDFAGVNTTLTAVSTTAAVTGFTVADTTVPSTGWKVQVSATRFCTGGSPAPGPGCPAGTLSLPAGSLSHGMPSSITGGSGTPVRSQVAALDGSSGTSLVSAPAGTSGTWTVGGSTLTLTIPPSTTPGTYTSAVTYTVSQGP